ncbi:MAG: hypothetical protein IKH60_04145 [Bacteroidales bacterium]|nr:hypothetical protein [Bacteroidales bacterium]
MKSFTIRPARPEEAGLVLDFIHHSLFVERSALSVYRAIGAAPLSDWTVQRLDEQALKRFAES